MRFILGTSLTCSSATCYPPYCCVSSYNYNHREPNNVTPAYDEDWERFIFGLFKILVVNDFSIAARLNTRVGYPSLRQTLRESHKYDDLLISNTSLYLFVVFDCGHFRFSSILGKSETVTSFEKVASDVSGIVVLLNASVSSLLQFSSSSADSRKFGLFSPNLIEGPQSPEQMLTILQRVVEESATLVTARLEAEERRNNLRLREEQDAAYRAALEADQARERQRKEEEERLAREAAEAERKLKEEEEARKRAALEAAEKEAALIRRRQEKAMSLGTEPEKGPTVTQVLVRFPTGERKERRFHSTSIIQTLYDYVDSLDCLSAEKYNLVSNFPRVVYTEEKHSL